MVEDNELVSVLMTVYNGESTLEECLHSILAQDERHLEVVVVDDGSTDTTRSILSDYVSMDKRVRVFSMAENQGLVAALNMGLEKCRGRWIARMDADDRMARDRISIQKRYAESQSGIKIWGSRIRIFNDKGDLTPDQIAFQEWSNGLLTDRTMKEELFFESPIVHASYFVDAEVYEFLGGYQDRPWAPDYDFLLRAAQAGVVFGKVARVLLDIRDAPTRLYRHDRRLTQQAMLHCKAHYFGAASWAKERPLLIAGTGDAGRAAALALAEEGLSVMGFITNKEGERGDKIRGLPVFHWDRCELPEALSLWPNLFVVLCLGGQESGSGLEPILSTHGLKRGEGYLKFF